MLGKILMFRWNKNQFLEMFRSTIRRLRRTLSFRSRSKHGGRKKGAAGGGGNQNWEGDSVTIKCAGGCSFPAKVWKLWLKITLPNLHIFFGLYLLQCKASNLGSSFFHLTILSFTEHYDLSWCFNFSAFFVLMRRLEAELHTKKIIAPIFLL